MGPGKSGGKHGHTPKPTPTGAPPSTDKCNGVTLTSAAVLSAVPHVPVTRTQYDLVVPGVRVRELLLVPTGVAVTPAVPSYH